MKVLTAEQMRDIERLAVAGGVSYLRLMVNAGVSCAGIIIDRFSVSRDNPLSVCIVCGKGNNAGDGFVMAAVLADAGCTVNIVLACGEPVTDEARAMFAKLAGGTVCIVNLREDRHRAYSLVDGADIVVDAVFGVGFRGRPDIELAALFDRMNHSSAVRVAVDVPSGVECDTGAVCGNCVCADLTIAAGALKPAHVLLPSASFCGEIETADIGADASFYAESPDAGFYTLSENEIRSKFPQRDPISNKGDFGSVVSVAGSRRYQGAAVLAAMGALRSGAGLVTAVFPDCAYAGIASKLTEAPVVGLGSNMQGTFSVSVLPELLEIAAKADALLVGCGLGLNGDIKHIVPALVLAAECPVIIDADGINALVDNIDILKAAKAPLILTPHPGEMSRLCGMSIADIQADRRACARKFADEYGVTLVLKGANTVVASPDTDGIFVNCTGNSGMAKGGSGDLLAGIIASFAAQGLAPCDAAVCGVYIHGLAGDAAAASLSQRGMLPSDCLAELPGLLSKFE